jgi:bla regulator protein blaR1
MQRVLKGTYATRMMLRWLLIGGMVSFPHLQILGQNNAAPVVAPRALQAAEGQSGKFEFEVASVRPNETWRYTDPGYSLDSDEDYKPSEGLFIADASLSTFIAFAYKLDQQHSMIANLPKWASSQSYEIRARVPGTPGKDQVRLMMQALLADRFKLAIHFDKQEKPALGLLLIKPGKFGPWLHLHGEDGCKVSGTPPKPGGKVEGLDWLPCGVYLLLDRPGGELFAAARNTTMRQLCAFVSNVGGLGRTVVDQTGITGSIDFGVEYTKPKTDAASDAANFEGESLVNALNDQLGLKLVPVKALLEIPLVDRVEMPSEN